MFTAAEEMERIRAGYEGFNRSEVEAYLEYMSEDIVIRPVFGAAIGGGDLFRGHDGARRWREVIVTTMNDFRAEVHDIVPAGMGVYVVLVRFSGRGKASGVDVTLDAANILTMVDGMVLRIEGYEDPGEALEAAGVKR